MDSFTLQRNESIEEDTENVEYECVICCNRYHANNAYPMRAPCGHKSCHKCIIQLACERKTCEPSFSCPQCRAIQPLNLCVHLTKTLEIVELKTAQEIFESFPVESLICTICKRKTPFVDLRICMSCEPENVILLQMADLSPFYSQVICGKCEVKHREFHSFICAFEPMMLPMSLVFTNDLHQIILTTTGLINTTCDPEELHPASIGMILMGKFLSGKNRVFESNVVEFLLEEVPETTFIKQLSVRINGFSIFIEHYLRCLTALVEKYCEIKEAHLITALKLVTSFAKMFKDNGHQDLYYGMWTTYGQRLFDSIYRAILKLFPTLNREHIEIMRIYYENIIEFEGCPVHDIIVEIYAQEEKIFKEMRVFTIIEKAQMAAYIASIDRFRRNRERTFLIKFFEDRKQS